MPGILIGFCGQYCARCLVYIASTTSDSRKKERLAKKYSKELGKNLSADNIHCWGCRADNKNCWGKSCQFRKCAQEKGIEFCYQCREFPCPELEKYYENHPEPQQNLRRISKIGVDAFVSETASRE